MTETRMTSRFARTLLGLVCMAVVLSVGALAYRGWRQYENAQTLAIRTPNGVQEAAYVDIGGLAQWIQIRGQDRDNPVLLILAGGPGNSLVPLTPVFYGWEGAFTVVQWDQRGSGKTYGRNGVDEAPMTIEQMARDGVELAEYLLGHLHKEKVILLGHSWGTVLGVLMTKARPNLFYAFVGTGQVVDKDEKERIIYAALLDRLEAAHDEHGVEELKAVGPPPYRSQQDLLVQRKISSRYDTEAERNLESNLRPVVLLAPDFSLYDIYSMLQGSKFAANALYAAMLGYDARSLGLRFELPVFIFNGAEDLVTPTPLAREYFDAIDAPHKEFVELAGGGHSVMLTMSDAFLDELVERVRPLAALD